MEACEASIARHEGKRALGHPPWDGERDMIMLHSILHCTHRVEARVTMI